MPLLSEEDAKSIYPNKGDFHYVELDETDLAYLEQVDRFLRILGADFGIGDLNFCEVNPIERHEVPGHETADSGVAYLFKFPKGGVVVMDEGRGNRRWRPVTFAAQLQKFYSKDQNGDL